MIPSTRKLTLAGSVVVAALILAFTLAACASPPRDLTRQPGDGDDVTLVIENRSFNDATIYAHWTASPRHRVGRVVGNSTETFRVEWRGPDLRIEADFLAAGEYLSERINVIRGDRLELILQP